MFNINDTNGDSKVLAIVQNKVLEDFPNEVVYGAEFGVAYGGGIYQVCTLWKDRGYVYGFDTFTGHPIKIAKDKTSPEATAMDGWYMNLGRETLGKLHITLELNKHGVYNYELKEGLLSSNTDLSELNDFHYVLLDLDLVESMSAVYKLVRKKLVKGGYLCVHDVVPQDHMPNLYHWWVNEDKEGLEYVMTGTYLEVYRSI